MKFNMISLEFTTKKMVLSKVLHFHDIVAVPTHQTSLMSACQNYKNYN